MVTATGRDDDRDMLRLPLGRRRAVLHTAAAAVPVAALLVVVGGAPPARAAADPVIVAAGDVACDPASNTTTSSTCQQAATGAVAASLAPDAVLALGDLQYESGTLSAFQSVYDGAWGALRPVTKPVPGNHEYQTAGASGYYDYFGASAGNRTQGWYSYDMGAWHVVALNSNCSAIGGCGAGSPMEQWLRADLAAHPTTCTLAYWHHPRWSSSATQASDTRSAALMDTLYAGGVDVVLNGHAHGYERFAPMSPAGTVDLAGGMREFVVGTGGKSRYAFGPTAVPGSEARGGGFGVLKLTTRPTSYDWSFVPATGSSFTDSGSAPCRGANTPLDVTKPSAPTGLSATRTADEAGVALRWTPGVDETGLVGHKVYRDGVLVATLGAVSSYTDTTTLATGSYVYEVEAFDAAGNTSERSPPVLAAPIPPSAPRTLAPTDDAYVDKNNPNMNYGAGARLVVDASPVDDLLVRFDVPSDCRPIGAALRMTVGNGVDDQSSSGGSVAGAGTSWQESTVTWASAPAATTPPVATLGAVAQATAYSLDVSALVPAAGPVAFRMSSAGSDGARYFSKESSATEAPALTVKCATDVVPPGVPTAVTATGTGPTSVSVSWAASIDDVAVSGYRVYRDGALLGVVSGGTSYTDTTVAPQTQYAYTVVAVDTAGNESLPSLPGIVITPSSPTGPPPDTTAPSVPTGVAASATGPAGVDVSWSASTDAVGVTEYRVLRDGAQVGSATGTSFTDATVSPSTTYAYAVQAVDAAGNVSQPSVNAVVTTPAPVAPKDETAPTAPTNLTATRTSTSVSLSWTASFDAVGVQRYVVYRDGVAVGTSTTPGYVDGGRTPYSSYSYAVEAVDAAGNISARSTSLTVLTPAASGQTLTFSPTDDTYVSSAATGTSFGGATSLLLRSGSPSYAGLLSFVVDTHACTVSSARLTLLAADGSNKGGDVYRASGTGWSESTVTWGSAPSVTGGKLATIGKVVAGRSYTVTVTPAVTRDGAVAFRLAGTTTDVAGYATKESGAAKAPKLAVTCA